MTKITMISMKKKNVTLNLKDDLIKLQYYEIRFRIYSIPSFDFGIFKFRELQSQFNNNNGRFQTNSINK